MSFSTLKIPLPYAWFCVGLIPWFILLLVILFYEPVTHADPLVLLILLLAGLPAIVVAPICFLRGFFQSVKFTGKHRIIGLTINGLGFGIVLSLLLYGWLAK